MDEIAKKRADKADDNHLWSPMDALEDAQTSIQNSNQKVSGLAVIWWEENTDGSWQMKYRASKLTKPEMVALVDALHHTLLHDWLQK